MKLSCSDTENIKNFLRILQNYDLQKLEIEFKLSSVLDDKSNDLLEELKSKNIKFKEREVSNDSDEEDNDEDGDVAVSFISKKKRLVGESITKTIDDKDLVFCFKDKIQREKLLKFTKQYDIDIDLTDKLTITGDKKKVQALVDELLKKKCAKTNKMPYHIALCLKKTKYVKKVLRLNGAFARIFKNENKEDYCLIVYADNQESVTKCILEINAVINNVIIILELSMKFEQADEIEKVTNYLNSVFERKLKNLSQERVRYEIGMMKCMRSNSNMFFMFVKCKDKIFNQLKPFIESQTMTLCFLNVIPKNNTDISINPTGISKEKNVNIVSLNDRSYLVMGKAKYLKEKVAGLFKSEIDNIFYFKLRFKRLHRGGEELKQEEFTERKMTVNVEEFAERGVYVFKILGWEPLKKIITKLDQIWSNIVDSQDMSNASILKFKQESNTSSAGDSDHLTHLSVTSESNLHILDEESKIKDDELNSTTSSIRFNKFPQDNQLENAFDIGDIEPGDWQPLEENNTDFKKLENLLKKGHKEAKIISITKCHSEAQWKKYKEIRKKCEKDNVKEYISFIHSADNPTEIIENYKPPSERKIRPTFNPTRHTCAKDEDGLYLVACIVLVDVENLNQIITYCPAYLLSFK